MRTVSVGPDPDAPARSITLPASWDDAAAAALAWLAPGTGGAHLAQAADAWIRPLDAAALRAGLSPIGTTLHRLLRQRQAAPGPGLWEGQPEPVPAFVLNLAAFHDANAGFDLPGFEAAVDTAVITLTLAAPQAERIAVGMADLAGLLGWLGLDYGSSGARDVAACLASLLRARADGCSARLAGLFGAYDGAAKPAPQPPELCLIPGLAAAAAAAWAERPLSGLRHAATCAIVDPGAVDALLGVETGGLAPSFSPLVGAGLSRTARARLCARGLSAEAALADLLAGIDHLAPPPAEAHAAMRAAVGPYIDHLPPLPPRLCLPAPAPLASWPPVLRALPARSRGYAQRATVGGHTVFLRTGEFEDGTLAEISITPQKESPSTRALIEAVCQAVNLGLQHGIPLETYAETLLNTRFGPAGTVEGDDAVGAATSVLDYAYRNLAVHYLGRAEAPPVIEPASPPPAPLLPLDLPRSRRLRLVGT